MITSTDYINNEGNYVPNNKIVIVSDEPKNAYKDVILDLRGNPKRDWFISHSYYCLPITMGNQYGFAIRSLYNFKAIWDGGETLESLRLEIENEGSQPQAISSGFGSGIITIQNTFMFRTEPGINIVTTQPPNYFINGLVSMTGIVETDNLRRDFTFNVKITEPNKEVVVKKGDLLSAFFPVKRYFLDNFEIVEAESLFSKETLQKEMLDRQELARQRQGVDKERPHSAGRKYFSGTHADGCPYPEHQKRISQGPDN